MSNKRYDMPEKGSQLSNGYCHELEPKLQFSYHPGGSAEDQTPLEARLLYLTTAKYERDWHSSAHTHAFSELFYVTGGRGEFMAKGKRIPIAKNDLIIINPKIEHTEFSSELQPLEYIVLGIDGLQFAPETDGQPELPCVHIACTDPKIILYLDALRDEIRDRQAGYSVICQNLINIILRLILRHKDMQVSITAFKDVSAECAAVKEYIDGNFKELLTLETLAEQTHQNKYYVAHTFKNAYGMSPIKYLMIRRIEESKALLDTTDYSVGQIASIVGFSSASHFSQVFRRLVDATPNEYRKRVESAEESGIPQESNTAKR